MFGFMIACPREYVSSSWIKFHGKLRKSWTTTLRYRDVTLLMPCAFLHSVHEPTCYSIKYNIYWLLSWIKVKGLTDGDVWEMVRMNNKKFNKINDTVPFLNWWGKSICIIAAEKYRNIYSRQYGDWGQVFIVGIGIHYGLEGPEMESQTGRGADPASCTKGKDPFPGSKEAGAWH